MLNQEDKNYFNDLFESQDWYHSIGNISSNKIVVYVNYLNLEILNKVPLKYGENDILIHFSSSLVDKNKFVNNLNYYSSFSNDLASEIYNLKLICGESNLIDMFFEIQDGEDSITNFSSQYTSEYEKLNSLIDSYGYNAIYDCLGVDLSHD